MAFSPLEQALDYVEQLPDQPSLSEGYSPAELKRVFDRAAQEIKTYLNETLIAQLESALAGASGAESIGSAAANGIPAGTLHGQILALKALYDTFDRDFRDAVSGILPPGTIAFDRLDAATRQKIDAGANRDRAVFYRNVPGTYTFTAPRTGTYRIRLCGGGAGGTYANPLILDDSRLTNYAEYFGFGGASASALETYLDLTLGESFPLTVGAGAAPASGGFSVDAQTPISSAQIADYFERSLYCSTGGASSFGSAQDRVCFTCPGGKTDRKATLPTFGNYAAYPVLTRAGRTPHAWADFLAEGNKTAFFSDPAGEDSALGCGGTTDGQTIALPGAGGGGAGGGLTFYQGFFRASHAPGAGANGLVMIDYIA